MKSIKEIRNEINESKQEDIADLKALLKNPDPKVAKNYGGIEGYKKMIQSKIDKLMKEETELEEGSMDKMSLQDLWMKFADSDFQVDTLIRDKGYGGIGQSSPRLHGDIQRAIFKHVSDKYGKRTAIDMANYGATNTYNDEYAGPEEKDANEKYLKKLAKKHGIKESTELDEAMSRAARIKRSKIMKRLQPKIKRAKERAAKKKASSDVIDKRAEKQAKEVLIKKWLKGKSKGDVPFAERERIEAKLKDSKKAIDRIKKKLVKTIRKQEAGKLAKKESTELGENKRNIPDDYIDFMDDDKSWVAVKATNSGEDTVRGEIAKKNWPTGAPVTKTFAKGTAQIPDGEFWVIVAKKYWYWKQDNGKWAALLRKGATPPFDY